MSRRWGSWFAGPVTFGVVTELLRNDRMTGYELMGAVGAKSGSIYPALARLSGLGYIKVVDPPTEYERKGGQKSNHYQLTDLGRAWALEQRRRVVELTT
ncbi:MAG: PadR family transcriptional regulator [Ilumatobacteraceae bacterium]